MGEKGNKHPNKQRREMVINGKRSESEQGGVAREASDQVTLVQPPPLPAGVSGDRQVKTTDDTGVERRAGDGSTGRYWGTPERQGDCGELSGEP